MTVVRSERERDVQAIRSVNTLAFETDAEARLVDTLRARGKLLVSLAAEDEGAIVGHIAFSRAVAAARPDLRGAGLGPMAVTPERQRRGIGSLLVRAGLAACAGAGLDFVVVLGHAEYYPRFGFVPARRLGLRCEWDVPDDVFMVLELRPGSLAGVTGLMRYEPEFAEV